MTISYNWLTELILPGQEYLAEKLTPQAMSEILTAIGLEVENLGRFESVKGGLEGLVIGEVLEVNPHPNADRLKVTRVNIGEADPLKIVCGAPNVASGQKVVVAPVGSTIYSAQGEPLKLKKTKIRGEESQGMICAEDEIGLGESHDGILVIKNGAQAGMTAREYFQPTEDWVFEIGLTPNRMDAMSHLGVARDVCAWLSNSEGKIIRPRVASVDGFKVDNKELPISVKVENTTVCPRYTGVSLTEIKVAESPDWLKQKLLALGVRPINNMVDITNFVLQECGQPLHAFDAGAVKGNEIIVKNLLQNTSFVTLDKVTRKLDARDLMICNAEEGMCIAGVFGGLDSGVTDQTTAIFLESAYFDPVTVRRTSFRHGLRTDAATHFEKGVDISGVIYALKRAANLMAEICGAKISSDIVDVYQQPKKKKVITLNYDYLNRLSGKKYEPEKVNAIFASLGFTREDSERKSLAQNEAGIQVAAPFSKPDIRLPADLVEEVMRIDGYDNVAIPTHIRMAPALTGSFSEKKLQEKVSAYLVANGYYELFTNSITNSKYYPKETPVVHLLNNLSTELDVMRPSLLETGLEAVAFNLNHKQQDILFYEFGKTYTPEGDAEKEHLVLFASGHKLRENWLYKPADMDSYFLKGHVENIFSAIGIRKPVFVPSEAEGERRLQSRQDILLKNKKAGVCGCISTAMQHLFGIKQPVWYIELDWALLCKASRKTAVTYTEIPRYPSVRRDLALILNKDIPFAEVENTASSVKSPFLERINLFDVFESEKLGAGKKSYAVSFVFRSPKKTLTDREIDQVMHKLIHLFENELKAEIRS